MMRVVYADTSYWIALLYPLDHHHEHARAVTSELGDLTLVTSELVLVELLNFAAGRGEYLREKTAAFVQAAFDNTYLDVVPATHELLLAALRLYAQRLDKEWSIVDCASFTIMNRNDISEVLTGDRHFRQAGFQTLY